MKKECRVTFRVDFHRLELLRLIADKEGFTVSMVVRSLVYRYLKDVERFSQVKGLEG